ELRYEAAATSRPSVGSRRPQKLTRPASIILFFQAADKTSALPNQAGGARGGNPGFPPRLENGQVLLELPFGELDPVLVPFGPLQLHVAVEDMRAERLANELRAGQCVDGLAERLREGDDPALLSLLGGQVVEVRLHRLGQLVPLFDPPQPGMQQAG